MRLTAAFAVHELRTQMRSLRFRVLAVLYALAGSAPAVLAYAYRDKALASLGPASYAAEALNVLPALTATLAFLIGLDGVTREQDEGAWSTVALTGMSSSGYLLRRWAALQTILLPLSALPLAVAAGVAAASTAAGSSFSPALFAGSWLMGVAPIAMTFSALALAVGTIAGGALNAFLLGGFAVLALPALANALLGYLDVRLANPLDWMDLRSLTSSIGRIGSLWVANRQFGGNSAFPVMVSESPWDARTAAEQYLTRAAVPVALAAAFLGLAVRYLRRTRPDVRPWRIRRDHSLRTFLNTLARLRERYTPDPAPARADVLVLLLALLVAAGASAAIVGQARRYDALGRARFDAEGAPGNPKPTPPDVTPGRWRVEGTLGPGREVSLAVTAEMRNQGSRPAGHLAFELNPSLRIAEAKAGEGRLALSRTWDRLAVDLTPPIPPGGSREVRFRLAGTPGVSRFPLSSADYIGFRKAFSHHRNARFFRDLTDLSRAYFEPAVSPRRIDLTAADLTPVPRYHPWSLDDESSQITEETYLPQADLTLRIAGPRGAFLADSCGGASREGRLESRCRLPLAELSVVGGTYRVLPGTPGGATVAVYPAHAAQGELHLGFLARGSGRLEEAWPGMGDLRRTVTLEWPSRHVFDVNATNWAWMDAWSLFYGLPLEVRGNLVLMSELSVASDRPLDSDQYVAQLVASRLSRRRQLASDDALLFRNLIRALVFQRLGVGVESGAAVEGMRPGQGQVVRIPPPSERFNPSYWEKRFPALVAGLRNRMGEEAVRQALDEVLSRPTDRPGTRQELFAALVRHGGPDLGRFVEENFVKGGLAEPVLDGVEFLPAGDGWRVTGRMSNEGDAEALCKVVLNTDLGPVETVVRAPAGQATAFELRTNRRPQAVLLDPDKECHRLVPNGAPRDRFFFQGTR
ncbi:MAG: hypothetical protein ACJ75H_10650 [Thermoanaerobaculia bacterium]